LYSEASQRNQRIRKLRSFLKLQEIFLKWNCYNLIFLIFFYHFSTEKYELIFRKLYINMIIPLICYVFHHGLLQCDGMASVQKPFFSFNPLVPIFQNIYIDCHMYIGNKTNKFGVFFQFIGLLMQCSFEISSLTFFSLCISGYSFSRFISD
jgi:hypothetical protein